MKQSQSRHLRHSLHKKQMSGLGWTSAFLVLFVGLILGLPGTAQVSGAGTNDRDDDVGSDDAGAGMADDETVGTLPLRTDPQPTLTELFDLSDDGLVFTLTGPTQVLRSLIVDAYGDGHVQLRPLDSDSVRLSFHGHVTVVFDERITLHPEVTTEVRYGFGAFGAPAQFATPTWSSSVFGLTSKGTVDLPVARMRDVGILDRGPVMLQVASESRRFSVQVDGFGGLLSVTQR